MDLLTFKTSKNMYYNIKSTVDQHETATPCVQSWLDSDLDFYAQNESFGREHRLGNVNIIGPRHDALHCSLITDAGYGWENGYYKLAGLI